jgi:polyferredoxin
MTGKLHFPVPAMIIAGPIYRSKLTVMVFIIFATLLLTGGAWCAHFCYMGGLDDVFAKIKKKPSKKIPSFTIIRFSVLLLTVSAALLFKHLSFSERTILITPAVFGIAGLLISIIFSTHKGQMIHCTMYCPTGSLVTIIGKLNPFRLNIHRDTCNMCSRCISYCRYNALSENNLKKGNAAYNCTLCLDCLDSCKENAIYVGIPGKGSKELTSVFITLVCGLLPVFLGLARI